MKVLYDGQAYWYAKAGGVSRYFYELMQEFNRTGDIDLELALRYSPNLYLQESDFAKHVQLPPKVKTAADFLGGKNFKGKGRLFGAYSKLANIPDIYRQNKQVVIEKLKEGNFDVFHPTYYYEPYFLDYIGKKPFVVTFFDLTHEKYPELMMWDTSYRWRGELAKKAAHIIAISESTKQDVMDYYHVPETKITVTYMANSLDPKQPSSNKNLPSKYIMHLGARAFYKNFYFMARAFAQLAEQDAELWLVCAGGGEFSADEKDYFDILGIADKVIYAGTEDADIVGAYKQALALIYPSFSEGFGIPVLEAFACGCPVISSNSTSLPEAGGKAAVYFEPKDLAGMVKAIKSVIYRQQQMDEMRKLGSEQLQKFSWQNTARLTKAVYTKAL